MPRKVNFEAAGKVQVEEQESAAAAPEALPVPACPRCHSQQTALYARRPEYDFRACHRTKCLPGDASALLFMVDRRTGMVISEPIPAAFPLLQGEREVTFSRGAEMISEGSFGKDSRDRAVWYVHKGKARNASKDVLAICDHLEHERLGFVSVREVIREAPPTKAELHKTKEAQIKRLEEAAQEYDKEGDDPGQD